MSGLHPPQKPHGSGQLAGTCQMAQLHITYSTLLHFRNAHNIYSLAVGPNQIVDIIENDLEKWGDFGSIMAFLGAKRAILGSLHR